MAKRKAANHPQDNSESTADSAATAASPRTRRFQAFERMIVKRSTLRLHESNPRTIDNHAFKKLRDFLRKRKLLGALQVNRRLSDNGFDPSQHGQLVVIGGHQRLRAMDDIQGWSASSPAANDYDVPIDVSELSSSQEKESLVALNNPGMQGSFDLEILSDLLTSPGVDPLGVGFDRAELASFIDAGILDQIIGGGAGAQAVAEAPILSELDAIAQTGREADAAARAANKTTVQTTVSIPQGDGNSLTPEQIQAAAVDGMKARRKEYQSQVNADANAANFTLVLVADGDDEMAEFKARLDIDQAADFIPLAQFMEALERDSLSLQQEAVDVGFEQTQG